MVENGNVTEDVIYGETPYPDDDALWTNKPMSNQVFAVVETDQTPTVPSEMIPTGTGGECFARSDNIIITF